MKSEMVGILSMIAMVVIMVVFSMFIASIQ
jgi:hypothetical protein